MNHPIDNVKTQIKHRLRTIEHHLETGLMPASAVFSAYRMTPLIEELNYYIMYDELKAVPCRQAEELV